MDKTQLQRLKTVRPSPGHLEINRRLHAHEVRLGIVANSGEKSGCALPTVTTIIVPVTRSSLERLHVLADLRMAADPNYLEVSEKLDAQLAGLLDLVGANPTSLPRSKPARAPRIMLND